jgi:Bacterial SH3 domain
LARSTTTTRSPPRRPCEQGSDLIRRAQRPAHAAALALAAALLLVLAPAAGAAREYLQLFVVEPYLELHTGPGRGYPVFNVVPREESVDVLFRRTDWFKVRTEHGVEGWASQADMVKTVLADGSPFKYELGDRSGFSSHRYETGVFAGAYGGANLISAYGSVSLNPQMAVEAAAGQFLGRFSNGETADLGFAHVISADTRWSPLLLLGVGIVHTEPKATLVTPSNRTEQTAYVGGGIRYYLTRRFFMRAEFKAHYIFTKRNQNEEADEWKLGFAFFF